MARIDHLYMPDENMDSLYTSENALVRFVHSQRLDKIVEFVAKANLEKGARILDAGCGEGHLIQRFHQQMPAHEYFGVDIMDNAVRQSHERVPFAHVKRMDLDALQFPDNYFDVVSCTEVLEHVYEYPAVIAELTRVLKPNGVLIITHPNEVLWTFSRLLLGRRPLRVPDHVNAFVPRFMKKKVGLTVLSQQNLPFGLPFAFSLTCLLAFRKK